MNLLAHATDYVEKNIHVFHDKRLASVEGINVSAIIKRKNPYLFRAKNFVTSGDIVKALLDAHISSNEETVFGDWLEGLAIYINGIQFGGVKSGIKGIDLEFSRDGIRYLVSIKSGPNWGNSRQIEKMKSDFDSATKTLKTSNSQIHVNCVNGCCYGKDNKPAKKGNYFKYCGQRFWEFISGDSELYINLIEPLGHKAKTRNERFQEAYVACINRMTKEFSDDFCSNEGLIDWEKIIRLNSGT